MQTDCSKSLDVKDHEWMALGIAIWPEYGGGIGSGGIRWKCVQCDATVDTPDNTPPHEALSSEPTSESDQIDAMDTPNSRSTKDEE